MQSNKNFTEKPKGREAEIADDEEERLFHERIEDLEDDEDYPEDDDDFYGMNYYTPYAGYEGGQY